MQASLQSPEVFDSNHPEVILADDPDYIRFCENSHAEAVAAQEAEQKLLAHYAAIHRSISDPTSTEWEHRIRGARDFGQVTDQQAYRALKAEGTSRDQLSAYFYGRCLGLSSDEMEAINRGLALTA